MMRQSQQPKADELLLRGLARGFPQASGCVESTLKSLAQEAVAIESRAINMVHAAGRDVKIAYAKPMVNAHKPLALCAVCLRQEDASQTHAFPMLLVVQPMQQHVICVLLSVNACGV